MPSWRIENEQLVKSALEKGLSLTAGAQLAIETQSGEAVNLRYAMVGQGGELGVEESRSVLLRQLNQSLVAPTRGMEEVCEPSRATARYRVAPRRTGLLVIVPSLPVAKYRTRIGEIAGGQCSVDQGPQLVEHVLP